VDLQKNSRYDFFMNDKRYLEAKEKHKKKITKCQGKKEETC
jgi:hypothetical protein